MEEYVVTARRVGVRAGEVRARSIAIALDTTQDGRHDALSGTELLLAATAAEVLVGVERAVAALDFQLAGAFVRVRAARHTSSAAALAVEYELFVDTTESDERVAQLHEHVRRVLADPEVRAATAPPGGRIRRQVGATTAGST